MRVGVSHGRDAQAEELVLNVECNDSRVAAAVELDASRRGEQPDAMFDLVRRERVADRHQRGDGAIEYFPCDVGGTVRGIDVLMNKRCSASDGLCELELELTEAVVAECGAETGNGRLRNTGTRGEVWHGEPDDGSAVLHHIVGKAALGGAQRVVDGKDSVAHEKRRTGSTV